MSDEVARTAPAAVTLVVGANGGCGASLLAGALALHAARSGEGAWLVELDLDRGDRGEAWAMPVERTLADLLLVSDEMEERHLRQAAQVASGGLQVINAPSVPGAAGDWAEAAVVGLVEAARRAAGPRGHVVLDGGTGASAPVRAAAADADAVLVVCGPTVAAVRRARRVIDVLGGRAGSGRSCALVVARGSGARDLGRRAIARVASAPVRGELPWSPAEASHLGCGQWPPGRRGRLACAVAALAEEVR